MRKCERNTFTNHNRNIRKVLLLLEHLLFSPKIKKENFLKHLRIYEVDYI